MYLMKFKGGELLSESELQEDITYLRNEWNAVVKIFDYGRPVLTTILLNGCPVLYPYQEETHCSSVAIRGPNEVLYSTR